MENSPATLPPAERAALALLSTETEKNLRELVTASAAITAVTNGAGRTECHAQLMALKNARTAITKTGKAARDDANTFCKAVIAEEKRLIGITEAEELRLQKLRDDYDAEQKRIEEEERRREAERVEAIGKKIAAFAIMPPRTATADQIKARLNEVRATAITADEFAEFAPQADAAKQAAVGALMLAHNEAARIEREAKEKAEADRIERERLDAEKADLERKKKEQEDRERELAEREARIKAAETVMAQASLNLSAPAVAGLGDVFPPAIESADDVPLDRTAANEAIKNAGDVIRAAIGGGSQISDDEAHDRADMSALLTGVIALIHKYPMRTMVGKETIDKLLSHVNNEIAALSYWPK